MFVIILLLKFPKIEISENSHFLSDYFGHCFYLRHVIIAGPAGGDWSELLSANLILLRIPFAPKTTSSAAWSLPKLYYHGLETEVGDCLYYMGS